MIEKTAISLLLALTALLQDAFPCPAEVCIKPDGYVAYYNFADGSIRYDTNFTSSTTEFQFPLHADRIPTIPFGHDGVISLSECQCQSNYCIRKCCSLNSTMDVYTGRCMDDEIVTVKGKKRRRRSTYPEGRDIIPCFGTCPPGKELLIASLGGGMHSVLILGHLCPIQGHGPICFHPNEFCIDYVSSPRVLAVASCHHATELSLFIYKWKFFVVNEPIIFRIVYVALFISILSLTVTFLVFSCFRELRNMHGKCLLCHIASFIAHDVLLISRRQITEKYIDTPWICLSLEIADYLFYLAPFSWMNVICLDILMSFMSLRPRHVNTRKAERKKFAFYSLYSWTTPLLAYVTTFTIDIMSSDNGIYGSFYHDDLGIEWCSLGVTFLLTYVRYPMSVYLGISVVLFVTTAIKIYRINASTSILRREERVHRREEDENKRSFKIYAKLLVVMGFISWVIESIHYVAWKRNMLKVNTSNLALVYAAEFFRNLQGLYLSVFFLWNDKIINLVKEKVLKSRARIIQHCFPQPRNVEPLSRPESSSQASQNPLSSVVTVTTCQGSQGSISESGYMGPENRENVRDFNASTGKPVEGTPSTSLGGSSCHSSIPIGDTNVQVSFSTASPSHEISRL